MKVEDPDEKWIRSNKNGFAGTMPAKPFLLQITFYADR